MGKVLVELEVPKNCHECPFCDETEGAFSDCCQHPNADRGDVENYTGVGSTERPDWCPFNAPKKMTVVHYFTTTDGSFARPRMRFEAEQVLTDYIPLDSEDAS